MIRPELTIRRCAPADLGGIERLVTRVVLECYGRLLPGFVFDPEEDWHEAWVAAADGAVVGVVLTGGAWLEDLWIAASHRGAGIGTRLLAVAEREIAGRGQRLARLRVVADNVAAQRFYARHGWVEERRYSHEHHPFDMVEMAKVLRTGAGIGS